MQLGLLELLFSLKVCITSSAQYRKFLELKHFHNGAFFGFRYCWMLVACQQCVSPVWMVSVVCGFLFFFFLHTENVAKSSACCFHIEQIIYSGYGGLVLTRLIWKKIHRNSCVTESKKADLTELSCVSASLFYFSAQQLRKYLSW